MQISGAELFVNALKAEQVDTLFAYPGGQAIDLFDALYQEPDIDVILPRHEQGLIHAADGYARSTGKTGVCLVTSGPGATNLVTGIATANYDSVPLVCFTGQVPTSLIGNDAFQEVDIVGITRSICKYAVTVRDREDLNSTIKKAFYIARSGKPGVVVVDIPKDIQRADGSGLYPDTIDIRGYKPSTSVHIGQLKKALGLLKHAKRPVFLVGGGVNITHAGKEMTKLAELTGCPVVTTIMGKGAVPTSHPLYRKHRNSRQLCRQLGNQPLRPAVLDRYQIQRPHHRKDRRICKRCLHRPHRHRFSFDLQKYCRRCTYRGGCETGDSGADREGGPAENRCVAR